MAITGRLARQWLLISWLFCFVLFLLVRAYVALLLWLSSRRPAVAFARRQRLTG